MSQYYLFPLTSTTPYSLNPNTFLPPPNLRQPLSLPFQLANALIMARVQTPKQEMDSTEDIDVLSIEDEQNKQNVSSPLNAENLLLTPSSMSKTQKLEPSSTTKTPPHKPQPLNKTDQKCDFRYVESLIVREPLSACNNRNNYLTSNTSRISPKDKRKLREKASSSFTTPSPPLVVRSCPICQKKFTRHWLLQGHIRTHTGERPFKCHICTKAFADKSNLRAHIQTHSGEKNHVCKRCGKRFALKSYLSKHEGACLVMW